MRVRAAATHRPSTPALSREALGPRRGRPAARGRSGSAVGRRSDISARASTAACRASSAELARELGRRAPGRARIERGAPRRVIASPSTVLASESCSSRATRSRSRSAPSASVRSRSSDLGQHAALDQLPRRDPGDHRRRVEQRREHDALRVVQRVHVGSPRARPARTAAISSSENGIAPRRP